MRLLAVPIVVVGVLVGIWVTGGVITNDFALAMTVTAVWMVVAGLACLAVAWRWRGLRVPVLGAYLVTAAVVGFYLGRSMFLDDEVDENVVMAAPRSEEHTSELQSRQYLVCRLLLEKKK